MLKSSAPAAIRLRGVRHNNLKNFDLDLPLHRLIVITGLSGSGKSSLAFDTLFAEGQRRYIETFSPYARQFFDRMDKPQVDSIEGIPPAIAIEQRNAVRSTRSTVGTMTEICDYMKTLWPHLAKLHCRNCGKPVTKEPPRRVWEAITEEANSAGAEWLITFDLPLSEKLALEESLALVARQGYQRLVVDGRIARLDAMTGAGSRRAKRATMLTVIQDRIVPAPANRSRFVEACEQAYHFGKGKLALRRLDLAEGNGAEPKLAAPRLFSNRLHCAACDIEYRAPSAALFSFNNPVGACPECRGFGRIISIDYNLALPDRSRTLAEGVVKPWQSGMSADCQRDLMRACKALEIPPDVPFDRLPRKWQQFVIEGDPDYGKDEEHQWPRAWYGVKGYFRWLESKSYKMHVRVLLSRYRAYSPCPVCHGQRFQPETLLYRVEYEAAGSGRTGGSAQSLTLADFYQLSVQDALNFMDSVWRPHRAATSDALKLALNEVRSRLRYLNDVGLGYLTLDRPTRSLSGGETERVNLTTCLGTRLVNTLFVLDEPSVGLHPRDTDRLVRILQQLRDAGNTVVVVEHEASVMRAADQIVDLGPGHGATGGQVVYQGPYAGILKSEQSLTGQYLSGRKQIEIPPRREVVFENESASSLQPSHPMVEEEKAGSSLPALALNEASTPYRIERAMGPGKGASPRPSLPEEESKKCPCLRLSHATRNNLKDLSVTIPLGRFVVVTGVSGSGKTTLVREVLLPTLAAKLKAATGETIKASDRMDSTNEDVEGADPASPGAAQIEGIEHLGRVVLVDQSILGKTPRSNPAVYTGAFEDIREFFSQTPAAQQRGLGPSAFSFNSGQGQCQRCRGAGFEKIEMQFLSDVFIRCPECDGRRYRSHILEIKAKPPGKSKESSEPGIAAPGDGRAPRALSIADLLDSTSEEAIEFLSCFPESRPAQRAVETLRWLSETGLGYLKLGQPINTLSGGESQRLKLVRELAGAQRGERQNNGWNPTRGIAPPGRGVAELAPLPTLFLFDEPTTGLHYEDVGVLLKVFQRLVQAGHSVLVIEHNLEVIKCADWIIDLGPEASEQGGRVVAQGRPEDVASSEDSHTARALREALEVESLAVKA